MTLLLERSQLRALSLVNVYHSPESFELVVQYLRESESLKELDLSWSIVKPSFWMSLLEVVQTNRQLSSLTLSFNQLLEDQNLHLTAEARWAGYD